MNKLEALTAKLGKTELETLQFLTNLARECNNQHISWYYQGAGSGIVKLTDCGKELDYTEFERRRPSINALHTLGFLSLQQVQMPIYLGSATVDHITLFSIAFDRVVYEEKHWFYKKFLIFWLSYKEVLGVLGFFISVILAILEFLKFLESTHP